MPLYSELQAEIDQLRAITQRKHTMTSPLDPPLQDLNDNIIRAYSLDNRRQITDSRSGGGHTQMNANPRAISNLVSTLVSHIHDLSTEDVKRLDLALEQRRDKERAIEAIQSAEIRVWVDNITQTANHR